MNFKDPKSISTLTGTGEFERKDSHVVAIVEIKNGMITDVGFTTTTGVQLEDCAEVEKFFKGKSVSESLLVSSEELLEVVQSHLTQADCEVLLESFHRAVESCLDSE